MKCDWLAAALTTLALMATQFAGGSARAQTNLVTNGTFQVTGTTTSFQFGTWGPYTPPGTLTGWSSTGYNMVFLPGSNAATTYYGSANVAMWGPAYGVNNGFTGAAPGNQDFIAMDADYPSTDGSGHAATAAVTQTISGLKVGESYKLSFAWAGAQQQGYTGATTEYLQASLGGSTATTPTYNLPSQGFSGWMNQTYYFVATNTSEVLSFLAGGSPAIPPFVLVSNVSMTAAPEPASLAILASGVAGLAGLRRSRRKVAEKAQV